MDYKELIERLNTGEFDRDYECTPFECGVFSLTREAATSITDLLARAEAAEARAEKAEKCISEIEEAIKFQRYSAAMLWISEYRGQKEE